MKGGKATVNERSSGTVLLEGSLVRVVDLCILGVGIVCCALCAYSFQMHVQQQEQEFLLSSSSVFLLQTACPPHS